MRIDLRVLSLNRFKSDNEPVSLCLQQQKIVGGNWYQMKPVPALAVRTQDEQQYASKLAGKAIANEATQECDHVWSSDFSELVYQVVPP